MNQHHPTTSFRAPHGTGRVWLAFVLGAATLTGSGCDALSGSPPTAVRSDSAGITLVDNTGYAWTRETAWRVEPEPEVSIGGMEADLEAEVYEVRGALLLPDRSIIVADNGSKQLKLLYANGEYRAARGREGGGPGEFGYLYYMLPFGPDSLLVWDSGNARYSVHDNAGTFVRTLKVLGNATEGTFFPGPHPVVLEDRTLLGMAGFNMMDQEPGLFRPDVTYYRFASDGARVGFVTTVPFRTFSLSGDGTRMAMTPALFGPETLLAGSGTTVWVARSEDFTLDQLAADGTLLKRVRHRTFEPVPVTERHRELELRQRLEDLENMSGSMPMASPEWLAMQKANFESLEAPETFPPYSSLTADREGNLWVRSYPMPGEPPPAWIVIDSAGRLLGEVELPAGLEPTDIGSDYVLGVWKDELDLEYVRKYRLTKGEGSSP